MGGGAEAAVGSEVPLGLEGEEPGIDGFGGEGGAGTEVAEDELELEGLEVLDAEHEVELLSQAPAVALGVEAEARVPQDRRSICWF